MNSTDKGAKIQFTPNDKVSTNLRKNLSASLIAFEKNKEWADVGHWLQKVAKYLEDFPSPYIPEKVTFAKRLAQCLNPSLPHGVHMSTLHIYSLIFKNMKNAGVSWSQDLGIYSIGIFPFFQYASFQVKPSILELYQKYYFPLKKQLIPCIPGLVVSILPGLDEQNEELQKKVFTTLDQACECTGKRYFIGAMWMAVLRTAKVRHAAVKYLSKRLKRMLIEEDEEQARNSDDDEGHNEHAEEKKEGSQHHNAQQVNFEAPQHEATGMMAQSLDKNQLQIEQRSKIEENPVEDDQATPHNQLLPELKKIENEEFIPEIEEDIDPDSIEIEYPNKSSLVINALIAGLEDDNTLVQRITLDFLFSHFKLNCELFTEDEKCILVEASLRLLIRKDLSLTRRIYTWLFGPPDLENKYQITEKNKQVLGYLITSMNTIFAKAPATATEAALPLKVLQNFYMEHDHLVESTLRELAIPLLTYIQRNSSSDEAFKEDVLKFGIRFMENITSYFGTILNSLSETLDEYISTKNNDKCLEMINLIEFTFRLETQIKNKEEGLNYSEQKDYLKSIISGMLRSVSSVSPKQISSASFVLPALSLTIRLTDNLDMILESLKLEKIASGSRESVLSKASAEIDRKLDESIVSFTHFYKSLVDLSLSKDEVNHMTNRTLTLISLTSQIVVRMPKYQSKKEISELPEWVDSLVDCIKADNSTISVTGIENLLRIIVVDSQKLPAYEQIKQILKEEGLKNRNKDLIQMTMERLWQLLDRHYDQNKVCELLILFHSGYPEVFSEIINASFGNPSITENENAIRRFSGFWKIAGEYHRNSLFLTSGIGLFSMLKFLENDNPLLRHTTKNWLMESIQYLYRIIDPIFEVLLQANVKRYITDAKQYFYAKIYDTHQANEAFRKLKSILIATNELFVKYISMIKVSEKLKSIRRVVHDEEFESLDNFTYLDLLVILCLRYIQGQAIESLSLKFQIENSSVRSSACEFLEILITQLENKQNSARVIHYIMEPLLLVMHHSIQNRDYVMQVQLINLFKVILFQSSYGRSEETKNHCISLLSSRYFMPNLLRGLELQMQYVREQYINFISLCIGILTEHLRHPTLTTIIQSVLKTYFDIILTKDLDQLEDNEEDYDNDYIIIDGADGNPGADQRIKMEGDQPESSRLPPQQASKQSQAVSQSIHQSMQQSIHQHQIVTDKKLKHTGKDDLDGKKKKDGITQKYQTQAEIVRLLDGVKKILQFFLKFKNQSDDPKMDKKDLSTGALEYMTDILTFKFLFRRDEEKKDLVAPQFPQTTETLLRDLLKIMFIHVYCWRISREFRHYANFTVHGMTPYIFEKFNEANKRLHELHSKIDLNAKNIKAQILSVVKPLTYQYTTEMMNSFISLWINECEKNDSLSSHRMQKQIEILVAMNISIETFINSITKNQFVINLSQFYSKKAFSKKNVFIPNYEVALNESRIFYFLFTYIAYAYQDTADIRKEILVGIWNSALRFVKLFLNTKTPSSIMWILEILYLLSVKYIPKELLSDTRFKKELHETINFLLLSCANVCAKNTQILFNDHGADSQSKFKIILPLPPTVYEMYKQYTEEGSHKENENSLPNESSVEKLMFLNMDKDFGETSLYARYRLFCFKTLRRIALSLIQNTYAADRSDRVAKRTKEFMTVIFPVMENKVQENQPYLECASELMERLVGSSNTIVIKDFKRNILDIFDGNDFFKCSRKSLRHWSKIIDAVMTNDKGDLFTEFLTKVASFGILFNRDSDTKQKIKSFQRICFVIYSGERDKYQGKLIVLLEKMGEVIKNAESSHPALVILVIFCVRILILRLSSLVLNELFRNIWPHLLTLLIQIFNKKNTQKNPNLILAALKLVELMSIVGMEEFYANQWVFVFDYFGLSIQSNPKMYESTPVQKTDTSQISQNSQPNQANLTTSETTTNSQATPFSFVPYIGNCIPEDLQVIYKNTQIRQQISYQKIKRNIIVNQSNIETENEIRSKAIELCEYLMHTNEFRCEVDPDSVESMMERDFISLDDYIFKMN